MILNCYVNYKRLLLDDSPIFFNTVTSKFSCKNKKTRKREDLNNSKLENLREEVAKQISKELDTYQELLPLLSAEEQLSEGIDPFSIVKKITDLPTGVYIIKTPVNILMYKLMNTELDDTTIINDVAVKPLYDKFITGFIAKEISDYAILSENIIKDCNKVLKRGVRSIYRFYNHIDYNADVHQRYSNIEMYPVTISDTNTINPIVSLVTSPNHIYLFDEDGDNLWKDALTHPLIQNIITSDTFKYQLDQPTLFYLNMRGMQIHLGCKEDIMELLTLRPYSSLTDHRLTISGFTKMLGCIVMRNLGLTEIDTELFNIPDMPINDYNQVYVYRDEDNGVVASSVPLNDYQLVDSYTTGFYFFASHSILNGNIDTTYLNELTSLLKTSLA